MVLNFKNTLVTDMLSIHSSIELLSCECQSSSLMVVNIIPGNGMVGATKHYDNV